MSPRSSVDFHSLNGQGDAYADLADVVAAAGTPAEVAGALQHAVDRYECKETSASARRIRE